MKNVDLWKLLDRTLREYYWRGYEASVQHVSDHVEIYDNERADGMTKEAMRRAHRNRIQTPDQRQDRLIEDMVDDIFNAMLAI